MMMFLRKQQALRVLSLICCLALFAFEVTNGFTIAPSTVIEYPSCRHRHHDTNSKSLYLTLISSSSLWSSSSTLEQSNDFGTIPVKEGTVSVTRGKDQSEEFNISYNLVRPMSLSSRQAAPIVVLHGGPSLPSNYCFPLAKHIPYRSILFYDQLGCGKSDQPTNIEYYSIDQAVDDLQNLLERLNIRRFHLYGQSYGGILAYEFLKRYAEKGGNNDDYNNRGGRGEDEGCLSVILSSAPTNIQRMEDDWAAMIEALPGPDLFRETHLCRTPEIPQPLQDSYDNVGTIWSGTTAISDYRAKPVEPKDESKFMPSALILRGEYDVVTECCSKDWKALFHSRSVREKTLPDCSHHGLLENGSMYGDVVDSYFGEYD